MRGTIAFAAAVAIIGVLYELLQACGRETCDVKGKKHVVGVAIAAGVWARDMRCGWKEICYQDINCCRPAGVGRAM